MDNASYQTCPRIFLKPDGSQWRVFVEAGGIFARPKLVRTLKTAGATICTDPRQADVILVDSTSDQGRLFIRDWSKDDNKVVLEHGWVKASLAAARVLGPADQWGGYIAVDNGEPISQGIDDSPKSPLPTPRVTPTEHTPAQPRLVETAMQSTDPESQPAENNLSTAGNAFPYPNHSSMPFAMQQLPPQAVAAYMSQFMNAFSQPQMFNMFPYMSQAGLNGPTFSPVTPQSMNPWNTPAGQAFDHPTYNLDSKVPLDSQTTSESPGLPNQAHKSGSNFIQRSRSPRTTTARRKSSPSSGTSSSYVPNKTKPTPSSSYASSQQPSSQTTFGSASALLSNLFDDLSFFVQIDLNERSKLVTTIKKNGGKITNGHLTADYVILYSRSKDFNHLFESATSAGRLVVNPRFVYDSIQRNELLKTSDYEFEPPAKSSSRGKRKRGRAKEDSLLESVPQKQGQSQDEGVRLPTSPEGSSIKREKKSPSKLWTTDSSHEATRVTSSELLSPKDEDVSRIRSPTPPPENRRVRSGVRDGFLYTEEEKDFCRRYLRVLFERDHTLSMNAAARAIHRKMDNHTLGSWRTFLKGTSFGAEYDLIQKRASIAYRKQEAETNMSQVKGNSEAGHSNNSPSQLQQTTQKLDKMTKREELISQEIIRVAHFFAREGSEGEEEDEKVWARLTKQVKCQTAGSWEEFYGEHYEEVKKHYEELLIIDAA